MSRLGVHAVAALSRASLLPTLMLTMLLLACGSGVSASNEECSLRYRVCNGSCNRPIGTSSEVSACKSHCDFRLITCDRQPMNASVQGEGYSSSPSVRANDGSHPIAHGDGGR